MNELISSFAGKRLAAFAALVAAIALLAGGGALSIGTAQAQTTPDPRGADETWSTADDGYTGRGLDHITAAGMSIKSLTVTLVTGTQHTVCLMSDINGQRRQADTPDGSAEPAGTVDGAFADIDDLDWDTTNSDVDEVTIAMGDAGVDESAAGTTSNVRGPRNVLTSAPVGSPPAVGWNWAITKKAGTEGTPTVSNPKRRFQNNGPAESGTGGVDPSGNFEACVYWTSNAPGTQVVRLYQGNDQRASGARVFDLEYARSGSPLPAYDPTSPSSGKADIENAALQLEVTWVDADPSIVVMRGAAAVSAPIAKRMVFTGAGNTPNADATPPVTGRAIVAGTFEPASGNTVGSAVGNAPDTVELTVNAYQDQEQSDAQLTGSSVSFAVTGTCGMVNVPGAVGTGVTGGNLTPGLTGTIASWVNAVDIVVSNTGAGAAACRVASSSTVLTITAGSVSNTITVNWEWDGYGEYTVDDVDDTTKKVTFHTAVPRSYSRTGRPLGWTCDEDSRARSVVFDLDGRASVTGFARRNTVGDNGPSFTSVTSRSVGATTPKRTLGATDSECQVSWTIKSPARAADVYLDITSAGAPSYSEALSFAPEAAPVTTFASIDPPLYPGTNQIVWQGESTPVGDAIGDSGALAVYEWIAASQSWVSYFPGSEGLGVNTLTTLRTGGIYTVVTPNN